MVMIFASSSTDILQPRTVKICERSLTAPLLTHQELFVGYPAVPVLVCVHEHLPDLCVGDVLGQVRHHLPEVRQPEGPLRYLVLLGSVLDGVRVRAADVLQNPC